MGKSRDGEVMRRTGSPSSSSSSDFEFTVSLSPSSKRSTSSRQCPADELFYKGQILPLHLSPRISMVRTLLLASSSTSSSSSSSSADTSTTASRDSNSSSSSDTGATASRDSNGSSSSSTSSAASDLLSLLPECDSSRPSSVTEEEEARRELTSSSAAKRSKYFSSLANRFSSVFLSRGGSKKDPSPAPPAAAAAAAVDLDAPAPTGKRANTTAKQVIKKCVSKVKPFYEKLNSKQRNQNQNQSQSQSQDQNQSQSQSQSQKKKKTFFSIRRERDITVLSSNCVLTESMKKLDAEEEEDHGCGGGGSIRGRAFPQSHSFSGNLRFPRRKRCAGSCPSSMRSSPTHSGLLCMNGGFPVDPPPLVPSSSSSSSSSMQELQSAIQGAIAHCKSAMVQSDPKKNFSDEPQEPNCSVNVTTVH